MSLAVVRSLQLFKRKRNSLNWQLSQFFLEFWCSCCFSFSIPFFLLCCLWFHSLSLSWDTMTKQPDCSSFTIHVTQERERKRQGMNEVWETCKRTHLCNRMKERRRETWSPYSFIFFHSCPSVSSSLLSKSSVSGVFSPPSVPRFAVSVSSRGTRRDTSVSTERETRKGVKRKAKHGTITRDNQAWRGIRRRFSGQN